MTSRQKEILDLIEQHLDALVVASKKEVKTKPLTDIEEEINVYFFDQDSSRFVWISIDPDGETGVLFSDRSKQEAVVEDFVQTKEYVVDLQTRAQNFLATGKQ